MKMNIKVIVAALAAAGVIAPLSAVADTITPAAPVPPVAQNVAPANYTVSYPVTVALVGGGAQTVTFTYAANGTWTSSDPAWTYAGELNQNENTAVFTTTTASGTSYGVALSSTGATQWTPGQTGAVTNPPSVGVVDVNRPVTGTALSGWTAATASGTVVGKGITTATLVGAPATAQLIGVGPGGVPVGTVAVGTPITVNPTTATSGPGSAGGAVTVNSNMPNQSIGWGQYTATFPTTPTPAGTTSVAGTVAGSSGSMGANGIYLNNISGAAAYNTSTGVVTATPTETAVFGVDTNGNTMVGGTLAVAGATALGSTLSVAGATTLNSTLNVVGTTTTNGIVNKGTLINNGNVQVGGDLGVTGKTYSNGIVNTGALSSTGNASIGGALGVTGNTTLGGTLGVTGNTTLAGTLAVAGATATNGITNTGNFANSGNLTNSGNATVGGTLGVTGATTLNGATAVNNTLAVSGATTLNGATTVNNTLAVSGATTTNGITNTGGLTSTGTTLLTTGGTGANSVSVSSAGTVLTGSGARLALADGKATFSGANATPLTVSGIANGQSQYDAVNFGQVQDIEKQLKRGISGAQASANIPQVDQGKQFNLGVGVGGFDGETAVAIGGSARISKDGILKASVGFGGGGSSSTVWGVGGGWSW